VRVSLRCGDDARTWEAPAEIASCPICTCWRRAMGYGGCGALRYDGLRRKGNKYNPTVNDRGNANLFSVEFTIFCLT
jgi:hypothetical protein